MKRGTFKLNEADCKKRFVLHKVKKRWVVTGIIFATLAPGLSFAESNVAADDSIVMPTFPTLYGKSLTLPKTSKQVAGVVPYATITSPRIDELTDTAQSGVGESHAATYDNSNYQSAFVVSAAGQSNLAYNTTINGTAYTILTPTNSSTTGKTGALAFNQQIDMTKDWTLNFNFDLTRLNSAGGAYLVYNVGDFIGLVLSPTAPNQ
ncbi:MAG: KxYKxGKxW signal peptide domain-containing protein, partial [Lactococcus raffinolactis]